MLEKTLQNYLSINNGENLRSIDSSLLFLQSEYVFKGGRIDILALKNGVPAAIELKTKSYSSSQVAGQLINYLNFLEPYKGDVYFVAHKINQGIISTLRPWKDRLHFYEFSLKNRSLYFQEKNVYNISTKDLFLIKKNVSRVVSHPKTFVDKAFFNYVRKPIAKKLSDLASEILGL